MRRPLIVRFQAQPFLASGLRLAQVGQLVGQKQGGEQERTHFGQAGRVLLRRARLFLDQARELGEMRLVPVAHADVIVPTSDLQRDFSHRSGP